MRPEVLLSTPRAPLSQPAYARRPLAELVRFLGAPLSPSLRLSPEERTEALRAPPPPSYPEVQEAAPYATTLTSDAGLPPPAAVIAPRPRNGPPPRHGGGAGSPCQQAEGESGKACSHAQRAARSRDSSIHSVPPFSSRR